MNAEQSIRNLAMLRLGVGVVSWAAPKLGAKLFGLDPDANPQASYLARLFGIRDIALAIGALQSTGEARRQWLQLGVMCDAADIGAAALGRKDGTLPLHTAVLVGGVAAAATGLGATALQAPDEG